MLFALTVSPLQIAFVAVVIVAGLGAGVIWYRRDEKAEDRNRARIELAAILKEAKLPHLAEIVTDVAVRDWDGLYRDIKALSKRAGEPGELLKMLDGNFEWQLVERWKLEEWKAKIVQFVADGQAADEAAAKKAAANGAK